MSTDTRLSVADAQRIARQQWREACDACVALASPGWDSFPATVSDADLEPLGALWLPGDDEPTLEECRPSGVDQWSPEAPVAWGFHPYNRCQVWACRHCAKPFLRYTEYGGYYVDQRIRELDPERIVSGDQDP